MLTESELHQLYQRLSLSRQAQQVIEEIRSSPPTRRVNSRAGNVSVRYPSRKMGRIIQAESHKNELAGVYEKEHDPETLEYYDQPCRIKLEYQARNGRKVGVIHTPDYFVIRTEAVGWEEWKTEEELHRLAEKMPERYQRDTNGRWRCPPGERYAERYGFFYRVCSAAEIDWVFQRNLRFLEDYLRSDCADVGEGMTNEVIKLVREQPGLPLDELLHEVRLASSDDVYRLIATEQVYVDLHGVPLAEPDRVPVYRNIEMARAYAVATAVAQQGQWIRPSQIEVTPGQLITWDGQGWQIVNVGETVLSLLTKEGTLVELEWLTFETLIKQGKIVAAAKPVTGLSEAARELLLRASETDLQIANQRYQVVEAILQGHSLPEGTPHERTCRRWVRQYRQAETRYGSGYLGLLPQQAQRGNRSPKLPEPTQQLMADFIENRYETLKQKSKREVYGELVQACERQAIIPPGYKTFSRAVKQRPRYEQTRKRAGARAAYTQEPFYFELSLTIPRHGDRPFEIGHIDHTQLDIELCCSQTGRNLGRPWATFLVDAFSRRLLAVSLSYDPPSYRACMLILRECVRRHGRLPQVVVVDGGREFQSTYFETLLARYECTKKTRPGGKPRFGSVCERLFGTANTTFVHNLLGNTQMMTRVRQVTQSVDPKRHARWTLGRLYTRLCEWAYEVYDTLEHPALGQSPREALTSGLLQSGQRCHRLISFDEDFQMLTLPTTQRGTAMVQPNVGVQINAIYYWSDAFRDAAVERTHVPVRYDPFDAGIAYAFVKGHWVNCISEYYSRFKGRSEQELKLATVEIRQRRRQHSRRFTITARRLAEFLDSLEAEEVLLERRLRDAEGRRMHLAQSELEASDEPESLLPEMTTGRQTGKSPATPPEQLTVYGDF